MPESMDRTIAAVHTRGEEQPSNAGLAGSTPAERIGMVWPLTKAAWAFKEAGERSRNEDANDSETPRAEQRLSRHTVRLRRR